jgi:hypothetical protein
MKRIRAIVAGGRTFNNYRKMCEILDSYLNPEEDYITIISGMAKGADILGEQYAIEHNINLIQCPALWEKNGKYAGYMRNKQMADIATDEPDCEAILFAFWNGKSRGTKNMIDLANKYSMRVIITNYIDDTQSLKHFEPKNHKYTYDFVLFKIAEGRFSYGKIKNRNEDGTYDIETYNYLFTSVPEEDLFPV